MSFKALEADQPQVVSHLKKLLAAHKLPHAMLFSGPPNSGKRKMAGELAKALFCKSAVDFEACENCQECRHADANAHPDLFTLSPEKDSASIKIEEVRTLLSRAGLRPFRAAVKIFIIDPADAMNDVSQNALLKTLEEPEGHTFFILISSAPDDLLPTIRSRAQTIHFLPILKESIGDEATEKMKNAVLEHVLYKIDRGYESAIPPDMGKLPREAIAGILDNLMTYFRDVLMIRSGAKALVEAARDLGEKETVSKNYDEFFLRERIELVSEFKEKITENVSTKLALSVFWDALIAQRKKYAR